MSPHLLIHMTCWATVADLPVSSLAVPALYGAAPALHGQQLWELCKACTLWVRQAGISQSGCKLMLIDLHHADNLLSVMPLSCGCMVCKLL